jgi:hypothetical protein
MSVVARVLPIPDLTTDQPPRRRRRFPVSLRLFAAILLLLLVGGSASVVYRAWPRTVLRDEMGGELVRSAGLRVEGRGRIVEFRAVYPVLDRTDPLLAAAQRSLSDRIRDEAEELTPLPWFDLQDFWSSVRGEMACTEWCHERSWRVAYSSSRIVSLYCKGYSDTGGAHGNARLDSLTLWWNGDRAETIALADLFSPDLPWRAELARLVRADLERQQASDAAAVEKEPERLDLFTAHPRSLRFHFPPYAVGCYAEGIYEVDLPYTALAHLLRRDGPAADLPTGR